MRLREEAALYRGAKLGLRSSSGQVSFSLQLVSLHFWSIVTTILIPIPNLPLQVTQGHSE
jgi:hypothetical protein